MKTIPQITIAEPKIRMPAWRRASPKKLEDAAVEDVAEGLAAERMMSPSEAIQSLGRRASRSSLRDSGQAAVGGSSQDAGSRAGPRSSSEASGFHRITRISGWVASSVWVKT